MSPAAEVTMVEDPYVLMQMQRLFTNPFLIWFMEL